MMEPWTNLVSILIHLLETLEQFLPLLVVVYTNCFVIIGALFALTLGQRYTALQCYVDDDIRFLLEDGRLIEGSKRMIRSSSGNKKNIVDNNNSNDLNSVIGHYVYMIRIYFLNYWQLDDLLPEAINENGEVEAVYESPDEWDTLIIELLDARHRHITKLQLDFKFIRSSYRSKFESATKTIHQLTRYRDLSPMEKKALTVNGNVFYQVKFLFQRATPLPVVRFVRIRKLTKVCPVTLYRFEISDSKEATYGFVSDIQMEPTFEDNALNFKMYEKHNYTPEPYDRSFNTTKVIWSQMALSFMAGVDILTIVSLSMLSYFQKSSAYSSTEMMVAMSILGTSIPTLVALNALIYYRVATNHFPAWRKLIQDAFHWLLTIMVIFLGLAGVYAAIHNALIYKFKELGSWVRGYFMALAFYIVSFSLTILLDFYVLYKI